MFTKVERLISLRNLRPKKKEGFLKSRISYFLIFFSSFFSLFSILNKKKPDFLIIHLITSLTIILFYIFKFKTKLILHIAGHPKMTPIRKFIWKTASSKITKIICPSNELKDYLLQNKVFEENKIFRSITINDGIVTIKDFSKDCELEAYTSWGEKNYGTKVQFSEGYKRIN